MPYTLADYARLAENDLKRGVVDLLRVESPMMDYLPFDDWHTLSMEVIRTSKLPTVGTRKINQSFTEGKGETDVVMEKMTDIGGYIDVDKLLVRSKSIVDQRALQTQMYTRAVAVKFNTLFIKGNPTSSADEFAGLRWRLINQLPSSQTILGGGLDVSPDATGLAANQLRLLELIDETIDALDMDSADFLIMNNTMRLRLIAALKASGQLDTTQDAFDRKFNTYGVGGPKILDIGTTDPLDKNTRIIGNTETNNGAAETGGGATSIYAVKIGQGEYLSGFQLYPLEVDDIGKLENGIAYRTVIDWAVGLYLINPFSIARLVGIIAA